MEYRTLTRKQINAIPLMLGARSIEEGCRDAGISRQTFYRWLREPVFRLQWEIVGRELTDSAGRRSLKGMRKAR